MNGFSWRRPVSLFSMGRGKFASLVRQGAYPQARNADQRQTLVHAWPDPSHRLWFGLLGPELDRRQHVRHGHRALFTCMTAQRMSPTSRHPLKISPLGQACMIIGGLTSISCFLPCSRLCLASSCRHRHRVVVHAARSMPSARLSISTAARLN